MRNFTEFSEVEKASEIREENTEFSRESLEKFNRLMGDTVDESDHEDLPMSREAIESRSEERFDSGQMVEETEENTASEPEIEPAEAAETAEDRYEVDDCGVVYKKNGELLPDCSYTVCGNTYETDRYGNKISCDAVPRYTEGGTRNMKEQRESGGEERLSEDDGGHIVAKILGGAEGEENLVPMRRTINRGDYKKMENEISKALQEDKEVTFHIDLEYEEGSGRPSLMRAEYQIEGEKTRVEFDNKENSTELMDSLEGAIDDRDYQNLSEELADMRADGIESSVTSVKVEYDPEQNPVRVTVGVLDEITGEKSYRVYDPI